MPKEPPKRPPVKIILKKPEEKSNFETNNKLPKKDVVGPQLSDQPGTYETARPVPTTMAANLISQGTEVTLHQSSQPRDASLESTQASESKPESLLRLFVKAYAPAQRSTATRDRGRDGLER